MHLLFFCITLLFLDLCKMFSRDLDHKSRKPDKRYQVRQGHKRVEAIGYQPDGVDLRNRSDKDKSNVYYPVNGYREA